MTALPPLHLPRWTRDPFPSVHEIDPRHRMIDPRLLQIARDERGRVGITEEAFARFNVAVMRIGVGARTDYLWASNLPDRVSGIHSEDYLLDQVQTRRREGETVVVEQLYSERKPCAQHCRPKIQYNWPHTPVFYSVNMPLNPRDRTRAHALMRQYGLRV